MLNEIIPVSEVDIATRGHVAKVTEWIDLFGPARSVSFLHMLIPLGKCFEVDSRITAIVGDADVYIQVVFDMFPCYVSTAKFTIIWVSQTSTIRVC